VNDALVMEMHYNLANGTQTGQSTLKLQFAKGPVKEASMLQLIGSAFSVPPRAMNFTPANYPKSASLPATGKIWGVLPRMHQRGRKFRYGLQAGGSTQLLIDINSWQYTWQEMFMFAQPIQANRGDRVRISCTWDNELDKRWCGAKAPRKRCASASPTSP